MLQCEHVTVRYGGNAVVDDLSFRLDEGQWLMLVGPNGAGKTTLIEAIAQGVPCAGRLLWNGRELRSLKPAQLARKIGVLSQKLYDTLTGIQYGRLPDENGWILPVND